MKKNTVASDPSAQEFFLLLSDKNNKIIKINNIIL